MENRYVTFRDFPRGCEVDYQINLIEVIDTIAVISKALVIMFNKRIT